MHNPVAILNSGGELLCMVHCTNCDKEYESPDELDHETVDAVEIEDEDGETPHMQIGVDSHDVWRCKGCGKPLGVR